MRLVVLYLRSRSTGNTIALVALLAGLTWLLVGQINGSPEATSIAALLIVAAPLAQAALLGTSVRSPFGDLERTASISLPALRLMHLTGIVGWALVALLLATVAWPAGEDWALREAPWTLARNLLGFTGLGLLAARVLGAGLSWLAPVAFALMSILAPTGTDGQPLGWAWPVHAADESLAMTIAVALFLAGLASLTLYGSREQPDEVDG